MIWLFSRALVAVTREMIGAAHDVVLAKGDFVLSAALLERIYLAMDAKRHNERIQPPPVGGRLERLVRGMPWQP